MVLVNEIFGFVKISNEYVIHCLKILINIFDIYSVEFTATEF